MTDKTKDFEDFLDENGTGKMSQLKLCETKRPTLKTH